jgi:hypothetical protein
MKKGIIFLEKKCGTGGLVFTIGMPLIVLIVVITTTIWRGNYAHDLLSLRFYELIFLVPVIMFFISYFFTRFMHKFEVK